MEEGQQSHGGAGKMKGYGIFRQATASKER
jgi:hypothetical protein